MAAVERGEMTVAGAVMELHGIALPDRYGKLVQAWNRCDEDERARFLSTGRGRNGHAQPAHARVNVASRRAPQTGRLAWPLLESPRPTERRQSCCQRGLL